MSFSYLPYIVAEIYCFIFALIVLVRIDRNVGSEHEVHALRNMIYTYFVVIITDIMWITMEYGIIRVNHYLNASINAVSILAISVGCYFWYSFICDRLHIVYTNRKFHKIMIRLPLALIVVLDILSVFTEWIFYIDDMGKYHETNLFIIQGIVNYLYMIVPAALSIKAAIKSKMTSEKVEYFSYAGYLLISLISLAFDSDLTVGPILVLNIFLAILILFLMIQNMHMYSDALTGLNNRRRLNMYLAEKIQRNGDSKKLIVFMMDINNFKSINDDFGHLAGDDVLKQFANVLKCIATEYGSFIARFGGDEFCLVAELSENMTPEEFDEQLSNKFNEKLAAISSLTQGRALTVSIGYDVVDTAEDCVSALTHADRMLYDRKKAWKVANPKIAGTR